MFALTFDTLFNFVHALCTEREPFSLIQEDRGLYRAKNISGWCIRHIFCVRPFVHVLVHASDHEVQLEVITVLRLVCTFIVPLTVLTLWLVLSLLTSLLETKKNCLEEALYFVFWYLNTPSPTWHNSAWQKLKKPWASRISCCLRVTAIVAPYLTVAPSPSAEDLPCDASK